MGTADPTGGPEADGRGPSGGAAQFDQQDGHGVDERGTPGLRAELFSATGLQAYRWVARLRQWRRRLQGAQPDSATVKALVQALGEWEADIQERRVPRTSERDRFDELWNMPWGLARLSVTGLVLECNPAMGELLGAAPHRINGRPLSGLLDPRCHSVLHAGIKVGDNSDFMLVRRDGVRLVAASAPAELADRGERTVLLTARLAPPAPDREEMHFVVEHTNAPVFVHDGGRVVYTNRAGRELLGDCEQLGDVVQVEEREALSMTWREVRRTRQVAFNSVTVHAAGTWLNVRATHIPLSFRGQDVVATTMQDVAGQVELREQLARSHRLTTLGTLAAGVAHEINNPLSYIIGNIAYVDDVLADQNRLSASDIDLVREALAETRSGALRVGEIVRQLSTLTRSQTNRSALYLHDILEKAITVAGHTVERECTLVREVRPTRTMVASEVQLFQLVLNLLMNAAQAFDDTADDPTVAVRLHEADGGICLEVEDNGRGMPPDVLDHVFEPFFTTRSSGEGTGLGLAIVDRIVRDHGGQIHIESDVGHGTLVKVWFPPTGAEGRPLAAFRRPEVRPRRLLLIDDDEAVLRGLARRLGRRHHVFTTRDVTEARRLLDEDVDFDAILCDVVMSPVDGVTFFQNDVAGHPARAQRFMFMTGGVVNGRMREQLRGLGRPILEKPFDLKQLSAAIDALSADSAER